MQNIKTFPSVWKSDLFYSMKQNKFILPLTTLLALKTLGKLDFLLEILSSVDFQVVSKS